MHNQPLHSRNFVRLPMARTILECYLEARKNDLKVIQSKRWGIYAAEAIRFGGYMNTDRLKSERREKSVWFNGTSKHAKTKVFDRIMKNTLGTTRFLGKPKTVDNWMLSALKLHDKKLWTDLKLAAKNYKNIIGNSPSPVSPKFLEVYRQWLKIRRGRNLFVKGFGKFDISVAVKRLTDNEGIGPDVYYSIDVTASGYEFHRWNFVYLMNNPVLRKHYLQYRSFWSANKNRLDELTTQAAVRLITENSDVTPEILLRGLEIEHQRWSHGVDISPEPFAHLTAAPSVDTPFGVLRPMKSPREVMEVGSAMKNCATNYVSSIRKKSSLLLALFDQSGHPIALGEVHYDTEAKRWIWGQRLGPDNKNLEKNLYEVFQKYPLAASGIWEQHEDLLTD